MVMVKCFWQAVCLKLFKVEAYNLACCLLYIQIAHMIRIEPNQSMSPGKLWLNSFGATHCGPHALHYIRNLENGSNVILSMLRG